MRDTIQFLQWLSRKIFSGIFKRRRFVSRSFAWAVECMEDDLSDSLFGWLFFGAIAILLSLAISLVFSRFYGPHVVAFLYAGVGIVVTSFMITVTTVLYRKFKEEQKKLMDVLKRQ